MAKSNLAVVTDAVDSRGQSFLTRSNTVQFGWANLEEAFPKVDSGRKPLGASVLVQIRHPKTRTAGGILLTSEDRATEYYNTQVAKVIEFGPLCFKAVESSDPKKPTLVDWPEGQWFKPGDFVWCPKYGGDRFEVSFSVEDYEVDSTTGKQDKITRRDMAVFATFKAKDIIHLITGNPLAIRSFLD